jgi:SulP family sulfate permease
MNVVKYIPLAVFSAILISVAINMSRFPLFIKLAKFGVRDTIILFVTCILTVVFDLTYGVLGGVAVTFIANAKNFKTGLKIDKDQQSNTIKADGTLFFVNANKLVDCINNELQTADEITIDMSGIERIDETALEKLVATTRKAKAQGKTVSYINYNENVAKRVEKFGNVL